MKRSYANIAFVFLLGLMILASCKKEELILPESNEPVFTLTGTIDGDPINLVAGDNGAFMHTNTLIENRVNVFSGDLSDGHMSVEIGIYDGYVDIPTYQSVNGIASVTPFFSSTNAAPITVLSKTMMQNASNILEIEWHVNDTLMGTNDVEIWEPGIYDVCAYITYYDLTEEWICEDLILGYTKSANCTINFTTDQIGNLSADIDNMGTPIDYVIWTMDGTPMGSTASYVDATVGMYNHRLEAEVHFSNGVVRTKSAIIDASVSSTHNIYGLTVFETTPSAVAGPQDFNIRIRVQDDGIVYLSENADNSSSTVTLTGFEYYGKNAANNDVYKITADINAFVSSNAGANSVPISFTTTYGIEIQP